MAKKKNIKRKKPRKPPVTQPAAPVTTTDDPEEQDWSTFPVVGIGASAGGLEAFTELLQALPSDTGMAFVFVQHLDPKHVSLLTELLQRHTSMRVQEAVHGCKIEPNQLYVIPRNTHMSLVRGVLTLTPRHMAASPHMPIDPFLRSVATDQKSKAIGVILSGNASDGTLGMMAIKAEGGITFVQSTETAKHDGMPRAAIAAGCVDFILPPKEIARELARLGRHPYTGPAQPAVENVILPDTPDGMGRVLGLVRKSTGVDFSYYKTSTIRRRILRRMALRRIEALDGYIAKLRSDPTELPALYEDMLINVTQFFRDPEVFEHLKTSVFPKILPRADTSGSIRIWVPGCSSGEEVYSLAMVLLEFLDERKHEIGIQIFGTDISERSLEKARSGVYPPSIVHDVSPERLRRFFTKVDSSYQISKRVREMCVFAKQNLVKDPPFSKLDLISCRNVLIYLGPALQKRVIPIFHYALKPDSFLLLGTSETIGAFGELFTAVDKKSKLYERRLSARQPLEFPREEALADREPARRIQDWNEADLLREADRIVLGKYAPPGVIVDDDLNIVQFRGHTSLYLESAPGMASLNLLKMAREGLATELRNAMLKVRKDNLAVRREGLRIRRDLGFLNLNIEVIPFNKVPGRGPRYLVLFEEAGGEPVAESVRKAKRPKVSATEREVSQLRRELAATREYMQSVIEEHESSNEELRSANEEIQSSNEELQSMNEELETAKEELQSSNEELNTVNEELNTRNLQIAQAGNDLLNLLSNVNIPIVMLDNNLRIRRFTPVTQRLLNLIPSDVGRPISDINMQLQLPKIDKVLEEVIRTLTPQTLEAKDLGGRSYSVRVRPYRTEDNKIDGVVLVVVDVEPGLWRSRTVAEGDESASAAERRTEELRAYSAGLVETQEQDRRNLALELHDDIAQRLALLELNVESLERNPPKPKDLGHELQAFRTQIASLSNDLRRIAYQLHPASLEDLGLAAALESYVRDFAEREQIEVKYQQSNIPAEIAPATALCLYRALQESLRNVAKHSGTRMARVNLNCDDHRLQLVVRDSGSGFDPGSSRDKGGLGLRSMEERSRSLGGTFRIESQAGKGTEVTVEVPINGMNLV